MRSRHDFFEMMSSLKESLATDYCRIRARTKEDPGTAGDQAEEDWAAILRDWLPAIYPVVTKGRILFEDGSSSPQVDVLVLNPSYPHGLRHQKYFFVGGVIAAFECKLTLRGTHVRDAFETACKIKRKSRGATGTPYDELNRMPIYGLLAHSHYFCAKQPGWQLQKIIEKYHKYFVRHPHELMDIICVADIGTITLSKQVLKERNINEKGEELNLIYTMYVIHGDDITEVDLTGITLAELIHALTHRMAFQDSSIRDWADHLSHLGWYLGIGRPTYWPNTDLSSEVKQRLRNMGDETDRWSKWSRFLP